MQQKNLATDIKECVCYTLRTKAVSVGLHDSCTIRHFGAIAQKFVVAGDRVKVDGEVGLSAHLGSFCCTKIMASITEDLDDARHFRCVTG